MARPRVVVRVIPCALFDAPPAVGDRYLWPTGNSLMEVTRVRRIVDHGLPERYRLFGNRYGSAKAPPGPPPLPWPQKPPTAAKSLPTPPSAPVTPVTRKAAGVARKATRAAERAADRTRVLALLRDDRDSTRVVHTARLQNASVDAAEWRDPDDLAPNRRTARVVRGYRSRDSVQTLQDSGAINKSHARSARRFRRDYELGEIGLRPSRDLAEAPSGFASGNGPSETRLLHLQEYRATIAALQPRLTEVVLSIVINNETTQGYAQRRKRNQQAVVGYFLAALDRLTDYYAKKDKDEADAARDPRPRD